MDMCLGLRMDLRIDLRMGLRMDLRIKKAAMVRGFPAMAVFLLNFSAVFT